MIKNTFKCTLPDGTVATRKTDRQYVAAIAVLNENGWGVIQWAGSEKLANQYHKNHAKNGSWKAVRVLPVA